MQESMKMEKPKTNYNYNWVPLRGGELLWCLPHMAICNGSGLLSSTEKTKRLQG